MKNFTKIILLALLLVVQSNCKKELNNSAENLTSSESLTPFTDIRSKYMGMAIEYENQKRGISLDIHSLSVDEKIERILIIDNEKNNINRLFSADGLDDTETEEDSVYYYTIYNEMICELNKHPEVIKQMRLSEELYGKQDAMSMTIQQGEILISKMDILREVEISLNNGNNGDGPSKLARYTGHAKWPGRVKYRRGKKVTAAMFSKLQSAMSEWTAATNNKLTFLQIKNSGWNILNWGTGVYYHVYVDITSDPNVAGSATLGYVPWSTLQLMDNVSLGTCLHELGHILGLIHEHQRKDRDNYINVHINNVMSGYKSNFNKTVLQKTYGTFDFNSIMMYDSYAFAKGLSPTMTKKDGSRFERKRVLSDLDKAKIKEIYN